MRVLSSFFFSLLFFAIVAAGGWFLAREILLSLAVNSLRSSISQIRQIGVQTGPYILACQKKGAVETEDGDPIVGAIQLRFTSPTEFVVEVVCSQFPLEPVNIDRKKLPWPATKVAGSSGIVWGSSRSGVKIEVWGRQRVILAEELKVSFLSDSNIDVGVGPATSCGGYGYSCCQPETTVGEGSLVGYALDCPKTCYPSCVNRPVVLSFTSQPFFDPETRVVTVGPGEVVSFKFVADPRTMNSSEVTLDFGDGQQQTYSTAEGEATHTYACSNGPCQYQAKLMIKTSIGITSAETPVNQLLVVIR